MRICFFFPIVQIAHVPWGTRVWPTSGLHAISLLTPLLGDIIKKKRKLKICKNTHESWGYGGSMNQKV